MPRYACRIAVVLSAIPATSQAEPNWEFTYITVDPAGPQDMHVKAAGDLSGDGLPDIVVAGAAIGAPLVWYEAPDWTRRTVSSLGGWSCDAEIADVDADGDRDIITSSWYRSDRGLEWFENPGGIGTWQRHVIGPARAHDLALADFDLDGDDDLVGRTQGADGARLDFWRKESPTSWTHRALLEGVPAGEGLAAGDLDGDGDLDVVIGGIWYENTRDILNGAWIPHAYTTTWTEPDAIVAVGDINLDGRLDIVLAPAEEAGQHYHIAWYAGPQDPLSGDWVETLVEVDTECVMHSLQLADFDGDGDLDVLTAEMHQSSDADEVRVYENDLGGGQTDPWSKAVLAQWGSHAMKVADFDGDGDPDILGANWSYTQTVDLWRNDSDPGHPRGDCDFDGDVDLADFSDLESCLTGPGGDPGGQCDCFDVDDDLDNDLGDFARFQGYFDN